MIPKSIQKCTGKDSLPSVKKRVSFSLPVYIPPKNSNLINLPKFSQIPPKDSNFIKFLKLPKEVPQPPKPQVSSQPKVWPFTEMIDDGITRIYHIMKPKYKLCPGTSLTPRIPFPPIGNIGAGLEAAKIFYNEKPIAVYVFPKGQVNQNTEVRIIQNTIDLTKNGCTLTPRQRRQERRRNRRENRRDRRRRRRES